jgi:hypothetical protein
MSSIVAPLVCIRERNRLSETALIDEVEIASTNSLAILRR